jgi:predicted nucleic acid-binding protein
MIADTTFASDILKEVRKGKPGPATAFFHAHRSERIRTTIITATELAVMFPESWQAWQWLRLWKIYRLHDGIAQRVADVDRELKSHGQRLGENDTWIAGFAVFYQEPIISHDAAFDRVQGLRRVAYQR